MILQNIWLQWNILWIIITIDMPLEIFLERTNVYIYIELSLTISVHKDIFDLIYNYDQVRK